jgi:hypothetical protein
MVVGVFWFLLLLFFTSSDVNYYRESFFIERMKKIINSSVLFWFAVLTQISFILIIHATQENRTDFWYRKKERVRDSFFFLLPSPLDWDQDCQEYESKSPARPSVIRTTTKWLRLDFCPCPCHVREQLGRICQCSNNQGILLYDWDGSNLVLGCITDPSSWDCTRGIIPEKRG